MQDKKYRLKTVQFPEIRRDSVGSPKHFIRKFLFCISVLLIIFEDAEEALVRASKLPIFFQWYGMYDDEDEPEFEFLHNMDEMEGRTVDNGGFSPLGLEVVSKSGQTDGSKQLMEDMVKEYKDFPQKTMMAGRGI